MHHAIKHIHSIWASTLESNCEVFFKHRNALTEREAFALRICGHAGTLAVPDEFKLLGL